MPESLKGCSSGEKVHQAVESKYRNPCVISINVLILSETTVFDLFLRRIISQSNLLILRLEFENIRTLAYQILSEDFAHTVI